MQWRLKGCDLNKDVEVTDILQVTAIDIQLKHADGIFRSYIKSVHEEAMDQSRRIRYPKLSNLRSRKEFQETLREIRKKIDELLELLKN